MTRNAGRKSKRAVDADFLVQRLKAKSLLPITLGCPPFVR